MKTETITIIGLRRTGLSIGLALKESTMQLTVIGHDSDRDLVQGAESSKAVDRGEPDLLKAAEAADIIVLAMPLLELENTLQLIGNRIKPHTLIIDLTELKKIGYQLAHRYLKNGFYINAKPVYAVDLPDNKNAGPDLFHNTVFCIMPEPQTDPQAVETASAFGKILGATPYFLDPGEYDVLVNGVEVLPGIIAAGLFKTIKSAPSWRDVHRIADWPFETMTSLLNNDPDGLTYQAVSNKEATLRWLDSFIQEMSMLRQLVAEGDEDILAANLQEQNIYRAVWLKERRENDWIEDVSPEIDPVSFSDKILGSYTKKRLGR